MSRVIERCPNCGVEHELTHTGPCEVCGSELRYWCRRHSKEIGWLDGPRCERCEMEAARPRPAPAPPRPRTPRPSPSPRRPDPRPAHRSPGTVLGEDAAEWLPRAAAHGGTLAWRLFKAAFIIFRSVLLGAVLFAIGGAIWGYQTYGMTEGGDGIAIHTLSREMLGVIVLAGFIGAILGLFFGFVRAIRVLFSKS